ncbi:MAG TPA: DUF4340 domain-containing protein [Bryobacteraceae bacterium]|nr:DUF4340 domain-containing protein [Bryobacteraceae bacterium]
MKFGRLLIAAVVLAGLAGALWWSNKTEAAKASKPAADAAPKIFSLPESDMRQIEIKKRGGETTIVKKDDSGKWSIVAPQPMAADQAATSGLASSVANLTADRIVDDHATDLPSYGLSPPVDELTFTTKDNRNLKLMVGDDTPTGSNVYVMAGGDPRLFTMASSNKSSLDKSYKDLRDKRLMTFDQDKISRVELTAKKQTLEFGRVNQNEWQILKPKPMRADGWQVEELVRKVKDANMDTSVSADDAKKFASSFASATPDAIVKVTDAGGTQTLEVRKSKDDYYAKSSVVDGVHKVTKDVGEGVDKALDDFRNKKLFDFGFNDPNKIEFKDGTKTSAFEKSADKWTSAGKPMDSTSVQALIDKLRDLAAAKFVESGFTTPVVEITVVSNDGKRTEKVQIAQAGDKFIARRDGESSLYQIEANPIKDLRQAASDVKPATAADAKTDSKKK